MQIGEMRSVYANSFQVEPVNTKWGPGPVNTNLGPGLINTNLVPGPVNTNWGPGPINANLGPVPGSLAGKYKYPFIFIKIFFKKC